jgi:hypothetical protein
MVGLQSLDLPIGVRIPVSQLKFIIKSAFSMKAFLLFRFQFIK